MAKFNFIEALLRIRCLSTVFSNFPLVDQETPTFCKTIEDCSGGANLYEQVCEDDPGNCECIEMIPTK